MVSFYVNGRLSSFGEGDWHKHLPQIGAEFHAYLNKEGKMANYTDSTGKKHIMVVEKVVYEPYISNIAEDTYDHIPFNYGDVKVYLIDKPKPIEIK